MISWTSLNFRLIELQNYLPLKVLIIPHNLIMGMMVSPLYHGCLLVILIMLAGSKNIHKCLNEFKFWPDLATEDGVSCP